MNLNESRPSAGGMMKKKDWITLGSLMLAQAGLILGIFAFGYLRLEARMDRLEARVDARMDRIEGRLDDLDRRVARIEGILRLQVDEAAAADGARPSGS